MVPRIRSWERRLDKLSDADLKTTGLRLRGRARGGESLDTAAARGVRPGLRGRRARRSACGRSTCSWPAGVVMHQGALAELATGEGKTLIAPRCRPSSTPCTARASTSPPSTITWPAATPSGWRRSTSALGLTVGVLQQQMPEQDRKRGLPLRHHLRHRVGVRLRLPARPAQGRPAPRARTSPFWAAWQPGGSASAPPRPQGAARRTTSPWSTRPTTSSSTRPARRSSSPADAAGHRRRSRSSIHWADKLGQADESATSTSPSTRRSRRSS